MENLDKSGLWAMLRDPDTTCNIEQADTIIGKFAIDLHNYCRDEDDPAERYRSLVFFRSFLAAPQEWAHGGSKKNGLSDYLSGLAVNIIDGELALLAMELDHSTRFKKKQHKPLAGWAGTQAELIEMHTPIQIAGKILKQDGEQMAYADVIEFLENAYGIHITQPYSRKTGLLNRTKGGAPFLEKMMKVYLDKVEQAMG